MITKIVNILPCEKHSHRYHINGSLARVTPSPRGATDVDAIVEEVVAAAKEFYKTEE